MLAGLGALDLTEEKARAVFDDLVARGEMSDKEARETLSDWTRRAGEQRQKLQQQIEDAVHRALDRMGLARRAEMDALQARLAELERRLADRQEPPEAPGPPPAL
jgi:polyhydroxyalkanoate synthesis regulator phasin